MAYIISSGKSCEGIALENDSMTVLDGGTANSIYVNSYGIMFVSSGGMANSVYISRYGSMYIRGGQADSSVVDGYYAFLFVSSGGIVNHTTVNYDGRLDISSGAVANNTTAKSWLYVFNGGIINNTVVQSGAYGDYGTYISSGGIANKTTVKSNGGLFVSSGGMANVATIDSWGSIIVSNGGKANDITVNAYGFFYLYSGGKASNILLDIGALYVSSGGYASNVVLIGKEDRQHGDIYVSSGGVVENVTIEQYGDYYVSSGGTANRTTINPGGSFFLSSGGTANSTTINAGGSFFVSSGATALNIVCTPFHDGLYIENGAYVTYDFLSLELTGVYYGSGNELYASAPELESIEMEPDTSMFVFSDGTATETVVNQAANIQVYSGGTAKSTMVNPGGTLYISSGGTATDIVWTPCEGTVIIEEGAHAAFASQYLGVYYGADDQLLSNTLEMEYKEINDNDRMYVMSDGTANRTTVNSNSYLIVSSGGTANGTVVKPYGWLHVSDGGVANSTLLDYGGELHLFRGGTANSTTITAWGKVHISSGGSAYKTTVSSAGSLHISSGGTANDTTLNSSGHLHVFSGGIANNAVVNYRGSMFVSSGGTANNTILNSGDLLVSNGGTANGTINNGGWMYIYNGGTANSTTVNYSGKLYISSGGTVNSITVRSGGSLHVSSGGTATDIAWTPCEGHVYVVDGGYATFVSKYSGVYYGSVNNLLSNAAVMNSITISAPYEMYVMNDGTANNTVIGSSGSMFVWSGGMANRNTVNEYGCMFIYSGGMVTSTRVNYYGSMFVYNGGMANNTSVYRGFFYVSSGGTANNAMVDAWGSMFISSGGKLTGRMIFESGAVVNADKGSILDFDLTGATAGGAALVNDLSVVQGTPAYTITVDADLLSTGIYLLADGTNSFDRTITIVNTAGDELGVLSVGTPVEISGVSYTLSLLAGELSLAVACEPPQTTAVVSSGVALIGETRDVNSGELYYRPVVSNGGNLNILGGGSAKHAKVRQNGNLNVFDGGSANSAMAYSSGFVHVFGGGTVNSTMVISYGRMFVSSGGTANSTTVNEYGSMLVSSGGLANNTTINYYASMFVSSGGTANSTTVTHGGYLYVSSGGTANSTTVNYSGCLYVSNGGTANTVAIDSGGNLLISRDGIANNIVISSGGRLDVSAAGRITGMMLFESGAQVFASAGSFINFDLTQTSAGAASLLNDLSVLVGAPNYTLTVDGTQDAGTYCLADGVSVFFGVIAVMNSSGEQLGSLLVGQKLKMDDTEYTLHVTNGSLAVTVTPADIIPPEIPVAAADITTPTNGDVLVTATFSEDTVVKECSLDGENWGTYFGGFLLTSNRTVYFRGIDAAGNISEVAEYEVTNIDRTAPVKPIATADITTITSENVTVTAEFSDDTFKKEYSFDGKNWESYAAPVEFPKNGIVYFRSTDEAGNESEVISYTVSNIDKNPPEDPTVSADITGPTNEDVTVSASFSKDTVTKEYSLDGETWEAYTTGIKFAKNGNILFRGFDEAGNKSEEITYTVDNIDKIAPIKPTVSADITDPTNTDVLLSAVFSDDSVVKEYSLDGENWAVYASAVKFTENGTVSFRGTDEAGNISESSSYTVSNIDKTAPVIELSGDIMTPLQASTLTASTEAGLNILFSTDQETWTKYEGEIAVSENGTYYFKATDLANNIGTASITFSNIDTTAPEKPGVSVDITAITNQDVTVTAAFSEDSIVKEYSLDGEAWTAYTTGIKFTENGTVSFRGTDAAGNISDVATYTVGNIDKSAPDKPTATADIVTITNENVTVTAAFSDDSVAKEYSLDNQTWAAYTEGITLTANGTVFFRGTDEAGNTSEVTSIIVNNIDKSKPETPTVSADITGPTNLDVTVTANFSKDSVSKECSLDNETWAPYTTGIVFAENGMVYFRSKNEAGTPSEVAIYEVVNIDKIKPDKPMATADITTPTNGDVLVTATFSKDSVEKEYSLDGENWAEYACGILFASNRKAYFRSIDAAGNISEVGEYEVTNIDRTAPNKPTVSVDVSTPTNRSVTVSAKFDEDSATKEYSLDGEEWLKYTDAILCAKNETVSFRGIDEAGNVSEVASLEVNNIDMEAPSDPAGLKAYVVDQSVVLLWNASTDNSGVKEYVVEYTLEGQTFTATTNGTNYVLDNADFGSYSWSVQAVDFAGNESATTSGEAFTVSGFKPYTIEYSTDNFEHTIRLAVTSPTLNSFRMPSGTYQMRIMQEGSNEWTTGDSIVSAEANDTPQLIKSDADGNADVFFANPVSTWESGFVAQHVGSINDWAGTDEYASVFGKNKLADIIEGSTDANILLMTDDDNGDTLFVDDIYTASPGNIAEKQSRIAQIDEIRAGAGNDIVDMTSQQFEYIGDGLTIRGGAGNDTIWANKGDNWLFGDAGNDRIVGASGNDVVTGGIGNDRMHGGGGSDVFTFCDNWGVDNVEQLATGSVTLWFAEGSKDNWDEATLTYTDGDNSVKVSGVAAEKVSLKFGDDGSDQFASLTSMGAFFDATTERIFEESGKGILASL